MERVFADFGKQRRIARYGVSLVVLTGLLSGCGGAGIRSEPSSGPAPAADATLPPETRMIGNDRRKAVVYECWYALRQSYLQTPNDNGPTDEPKFNGNVVGGWNYLANDVSAMNAVIPIVGSGNHSVASNPGFGSSDGYALKKAGSPDKRYLGRGGQCTYFTCLILYRALGGFRFSTAKPAKAGQEQFRWVDLDANKYPSAYSAQPGDVVFRKGSINHIGICVINFGGGILDIVDSNNLGYNNATYGVGKWKEVWNSEMIGRHRVDVNKDGYRLFSGDKNKNPLGWY